MKAFNDWDKQNEINYAQTSNGELNVQAERRKAYRAALNWVLKNAVLNTGDYDIIEAELGV